MKGAVWRLTEGTLQAGGHFEVHCVLLIEDAPVWLIEVNYCKGTGPGAKLVASPQRHSKQCIQLQGAEITCHTVFFSVDGRLSSACVVFLFFPERMTGPGTSKGLPNLHESSMPILCNMRTNLQLTQLPQSDVPLKTYNTHHNRSTLEPRASRDPLGPH
eukprot:1139069-Pelagomonas_calceolata.AAC.2